MYKHISIATDGSDLGCVRDGQFASRNMAVRIKRPDRKVLGAKRLGSTEIGVYFATLSSG